MSRISPIPTTRVSDSYSSQRLLSQLQFDQVELLKIQSQISTGRRIQLPSDDAPVALRAITLQKLLEQKTQVQTNLATNQSFLSATDSAISQVSNLINQTRASAQAVNSSIATQDQREAAAQQIDRALQQLVDTANQTYRNRYLFAGSTTGTTPYTYDGKNIVYNGNESELQSYSDTDILFETNVPGSKVFGAFSQSIQGTVDINPTLSGSTRLAELNRGEGLKLGSIQISDGTASVTLDLSKAHTLQDVKDILEKHPPLNRIVTATITNNSLQISLDSLGGGNLFITEVGSDTTASDLGLYNITPSGVTVTGRDLDPAVTKTTRINDLFGTRASIKIPSPGLNNNLVVNAKTRGAALNGYTINFVDDNTVTAGNEVVAFNSGTNTFTINIDSGATTASQVVNALTNDATFSANFTVGLDTSVENNDGTGFVDLAVAGVTVGGTGTEFDKNSGIKVTNGGQVYTIDFDNANTVEDLLNIINSSGANVLAEINPTTNGINIRSRLSGADFMIGENGGTTAAHLGIKTLTGSTQLSALNHGIGVHTNPNGDDFKITRRDNKGLLFNVDGLQTVQDVVNLINNHPDNQDPLARVVASLDENGGGLKLVDNSTGIHPFKVEKVNNTQTAEDLGLIPVGQTFNSISTADPTATIVGRDVNKNEADSIFNAFLRMRDALRSNNTVETNRSFELVDNASQVLNFSRADLGARQQSLDVLQIRLEDEDVELRLSLSNEIEIDLAEAISNLTSRQAAMQASLQLISQVSRLTLLDYL